LQTAWVIGYSRVPLPPAKTMPFTGTSVRDRFGCDEVG
jgi:hypothetical protein